MGLIFQWAAPVSQKLACQFHLVYFIRTQRSTFKVCKVNHAVQRGSISENIHSLIAIKHIDILEKIKMAINLHVYNEMLSKGVLHLVSNIVHYFHLYFFISMIYNICMIIKS